MMSGSVGERGGGGGILASLYKFSRSYRMNLCSKTIHVSVTTQPPFVSELSSFIQSLCFVMYNSKRTIIIHNPLGCKRVGSK